MYAAEIAKNHLVLIHNFVHENQSADNFDLLFISLF